ncbi:MAG: alpha/beta hydrolase [Congregibacter sp.]|nr:alpha/beta hydrolase [Congregibacter sp.]
MRGIVREEYANDAAPAIVSFVCRQSLGISDMWGSRLRSLLGTFAALAAPVALTALAAFTATPAISEEHSVWINNGEYQVPGILGIPDAGTALMPAVLMLHGTASQKNEVGDLYLHLANALADADIASLRIDFAGAGDSPVDHSRFSLSGATGDAQASFDFLAAHPAINPEKIIVLGFSQGGLIAQRLALQEPSILALSTWSTVATNGPGSFKDFFDSYYAEALRAGYASVNFDWLSEPLVFSLLWFEEIKAQLTLSEMPGFHRPILALAGTADDTVPYQQSVDLVAQSRHPMSQLVLLAGANHIFNALTPAADAPGSVTQHDRLLSVTLEWMTTLVD